jgi:hypothetical protein
MSRPSTMGVNLALLLSLSGVGTSDDVSMIRGYSDHAANERTFLAWVRTAIA